MMAPSMRVIWPWLALAAVGLGATWLRYGLVESSTLAPLCSDGAGPWWCSWRQGLVLGFLHNVYGVAALLMALLAILLPRTGVAWLAAALGLFALVLYCFQSGAIALLIGALRLLRAQAQTPPGLQDRPRERDVQHQP